MWAYSFTQNHSNVSVLDLVQIHVFYVNLSSLEYGSVTALWVVNVWRVSRMNLSHSFGSVHGGLKDLKNSISTILCGEPLHTICGCECRCVHVYNLHQNQ